MNEKKYIVSDIRYLNDVRGFTIIELMIATTIFTVVLLIATNNIESFYKIYYKGVVSSSTQNVTRSVSSDIEQSIQFSQYTPQFMPATSTEPGYLCAGNSEYVYYTGQATPYNTEPYTMLRVPYTGTCIAYNTHPPSISNGASLIGNYIRIVTLQVTQMASPQSLWKINLRLAYTSGGNASQANALLCAPGTVPGSCNPGSRPLSSFTSPDITCKTQSGYEFCDVADLQTIVENRFLK